MAANIPYVYKCIMLCSRHFSDLVNHLLEDRYYFEICHLVLKKKKKKFKSYLEL